MTRKIFTAIISVAVISIAFCCIFLVSILHSYFNGIVFAELKNEAEFISAGISAHGDSYIEEIQQFSNRITVITPDGVVVYDSKADEKNLDNHIDREEIKEALENGEGRSSRYSNTFNNSTLYYALKMKDGRIVRVSVETDSVWSLMLGVLQPMSVITVLAIILAAVLSTAIAKHIITPINQIDLNNPEQDEPYEELAPLMKKIRIQNKSIRNQMKELKRKQEEFSIITESMSEGFLIIDGKTEILSYNSAALTLLGVSREDAAKAKSVLSLNRSEEFRNAVDLSLNGEHNEQTLTSGAAIYRILANPVFYDSEVTGVIILIFDVTEKEQREQLRQEFTSNVSHELKTPLTTIYGISDMLAGGIVKADDVKGFSETIRSEAERMITLINDIIKLSQLDENNASLEKCEVDLYKTAQSAAERLEHTAEKADVSIFVTGEEQIVNGVPAIIEEIIYNLSENAIKYNRTGGKVVITVESRMGKPTVCVEDTGIGIPPEHLNRVFERFYRVDKSHSRRIGGTGLGLSIVKHGAAFHGASIKLESTENVGTKVTVTF